MRWRNHYYIDLTLPFGLRSAPFIFDSVASMVEWTLRNRYNVRFIFHYLDDFFTLAPANSSECATNVEIARTIFHRFGLPLNPTECEGPTSRLVFLGVQLDSVAQLARLPEAKFSATESLLHHWQSKRWCSRTELESLIGTLHHVCKVIPPGRSFLRRMIDLLCAFRSPNHPIRLNVEFQLDLAWWLEFFGSWDGVSFFRMPTIASLPDLFIASDAAGAAGFGAVWRNAWFAHTWPPALISAHITVWELFPIVVAAHLWGYCWSRRSVQFLCDNMAVVDIINSGASRDRASMHLMRRLTLVACRHHFSFSARHVPGRSNTAADALSRFRFQEFHRLRPTADPLPTPIPPSLVQSLLTTP